MSPSELLYVSSTAWRCTTFNWCSYHWPIKRSHSFFQSQFAEQKAKDCTSSGSFQHTLQLFFLWCRLSWPVSSAISKYKRKQQLWHQFLRDFHSSECFGHVMFWKKRRCLASKHSSGNQQMQLSLTYCFWNFSKEGKEKKKERGGKSRRREKSDGCALSFYNGYFGAFGRKQNAWRKRSIWWKRFKKSGQMYVSNGFSYRACTCENGG